MTNSVNGAKIMGGMFAFGEPTHARPIASEHAWRSLNRGLGRSSIFVTHSLTISLKQQRESDGPGEGSARANQGDRSRDSFSEESRDLSP